MSYENMGTVRGECVSGCACQPATWSAHQSGLVSQPKISKPGLHPRLVARRPEQLARDSSASCPCVLRLTVLNESESAGHKFKMLAVFTGFHTEGMVEVPLGKALGDVVA